MYRLWILICVLIIHTKADGQSPDLSAWKIDSLPDYAKLVQYNNSRKDFCFVQKEKGWVVERMRINRSDTIIGDSPLVSFDFLRNQIGYKWQGRWYGKKIKDGYFAAVNMGEFGGKLIFINDQKTFARVQLIASYINVNGFFQIGETLFIADGLAHLGSNYGSIQALYKDENGWYLKSVEQLKAAPFMVFQRKDDVLIFTTQHIYQMTANQKIREILTAPFDWGILYPSSVLIDVNDLYLAMRGGILKITDFMSKPAFFWYTPKE